MARRRGQRERLERAGQWLAEAREARGLTQKELAANIQRTSAAISNYERGLTRVPDDAASLIAEALRLPEAEVRRQLGLYVPPDAPANPLDGVLRLPEGVTLTQKQHRALDALLDAFLDDLERAAP